MSKKIDYEKALKEEIVNLKFEIDDKEKKKILLKLVETLNEYKAAKMANVPFEKYYDYFISDDRFRKWIMILHEYNTEKMFSKLLGGFGFYGSEYQKKFNSFKEPLIKLYSLRKAYENNWRFKEIGRRKKAEASRSLPEEKEWETLPDIEEG